VVAFAADIEQGGVPNHAVVTVSSSPLSADTPEEGCPGDCRGQAQDATTTDETLVVEPTAQTDSGNGETGMR
jgi:hypothetical protein